MFVLIETGLSYEQMSDEHRQLFERISALSNHELLRIVYIDYAQYRSEAITFAKCEISKRGIAFKQSDVISSSDLSPARSLVTLSQSLCAFILSLVSARAFTVGCLSSLFLVGAANVYSYSHMYDEIYLDDGFASFGFPFQWYSVGGFSGTTHISWEGLLANILLAVCVGHSIGWILKRLVKAPNN